jgi:PII-like signaling protein
VLGFGATARIRTHKILDLSSDLPMVVEIVDEEGKIVDFKDSLSELFEQARCGGLVTLENVRIIHYLQGTKKAAQ